MTDDTTACWSCQLCIAVGGSSQRSGAPGSCHVDTTADMTDNKTAYFYSSARLSQMGLPTTASGYQEHPQAVSAEDRSSVACCHQMYPCNTFSPHLEGGVRGGNAAARVRTGHGSGHGSGRLSIVQTVPVPMRDTCTFQVCTCVKDRHGGSGQEDRMALAASDLLGFAPPIMVYFK